MGKETCVVFDFDGTISTLRCGWEQIMEPLMLEMICPDSNYSPELRKNVTDYIDQSTGIQTAYQMKWLAEQVEQATGVSRDVWYYKEQYNQRILDYVERKKQRIRDGIDEPSSYLMEGSVEFLRRLRERGCRLFLASGTDDADVKEEARFLGVDTYFEDIKGAPAGSFGCSKELVLNQLMENAGEGARLAVFGDGKVEIQLAKKVGALAVGIASNEPARHGIDEHKRQRLEAAGADVIYGDFLPGDELVRLVMGEEG